MVDCKQLPCIIAMVFPSMISPS